MSTDRKPAPQDIPEPSLKSGEELLAAAILGEIRFIGLEDQGHILPVYTAHYEMLVGPSIGDRRTLVVSRGSAAIIRRALQP